MSKSHASSTNSAPKSPVSSTTKPAIKRVKVSNSGGEVKYISKVLEAAQTTTAMVPSSSSSAPEAVPQDRSRPASQLGSQGQRNTLKTPSRVNATQHPPTPPPTSQITVTTQSLNEVMKFLAQSKSRYSQMCRRLLPLEEEAAAGPIRAARKEMQSLWQKAHEQMEQLRASATLIKINREINALSKAASLPSPPQDMATLKATSVVTKASSPAAKATTPIKAPVPIKKTPPPPNVAAVVAPAAPVAKNTPSGKSTPVSQASRVASSAPTVHPDDEPPSDDPAWLFENATRPVPAPQEKRHPARPRRPRGRTSLFHDKRSTVERGSISIVPRQIDTLDNTNCKSVNAIGTLAAERLISAGKRKAALPRQPENWKKEAERIEDELEVKKYNSGLKYKFFAEKEEKAGKKAGETSAGGKRKRDGDSEDAPNKRIARDAL